MNIDKRLKQKAKIIDFIKQYKKREFYQNMIKNKLKKDRIAKKIINLQNNNDAIYFNKIDKVYKLENLHKRINWFRYYLEVYIVELLNKYNNIKNNKINL